MKKPRFWLSVLVSAALLALALRRIQPGEVLQALRSARWQFLVLAALVRVALAGVRAFRWQILLAPAARRVRLASLFRAWLIGFFGNYTLPSQSGELLKLYALGRMEHLSRSAILGTLVLERTSDVLVLSLALIALLLVLPLPAWVNRLGWVALAAWVVGLAFLTLLARRRTATAGLLDRLLRRVLPRWAQWGTSHFGLFVDGLNALLAPRTFAAVVALSLMVWGVQWLPFALVGQAMDLAIPATGYLLLMVVFNLASLVPALPGRLGTLEFVFTTVLAFFQADGSVAISYALLFRATHLLPLALGGLFFVLEEGAPPEPADAPVQEG